MRPGDPVVIRHLKPWRPGRQIQLRGLIDALEGDTLVVRRQFGGSPGSAYDGVHARQEVGDHGVVVLRRGAWVSLRRYLRRSGALIGELYNVQTPTLVGPHDVRYVDLEVDVARLPGGAVELQDERDLELAVARHHIPAEVGDLARWIAEQLVARLRAAGLDDAEWDVRPAPDALTPEVERYLRRWA